MKSFNTEAEAIKHIEENGCDDFNGMNCDDGDCGGWDGESYRCDCGNRRVMLLTEQRTDGTWVAYGEAY